MKSIPGKKTVMVKKSPQSRILTPLGVIVAFLSLTEVVAGIAAAKTTGYVQGGLTVFVCVFPVLVLLGFFGILWAKPHVFYPPADFGSRQDVREYVEAMQGRAEQSRPTLAEPGRMERDKPLLPTTPPQVEPEQEAEPDKDALSSAAIEKTEVSQTAEELQIAMVMAFMGNELEEAERAFVQLRDVEKDPSKKADNEVWHAYLQFIYAHQTTGFDELLRFSKESKTCSQANFYLGLCYQRLKEFEKAIDALKISVGAASESMKPHRVVSLAEAYLAANKPELALQALSEALETSKTTEHAVLYRGLAEVFDQTANHELRALALELALDAKPQDTDSRFSAAYAYSNHGFSDMAVMHYAAQLAAKPESFGALNNLGVAYQNLQMPILAVSYYRRSFKLKHALAGANLAYQFLEAGFHDEAKAILEEAKTLDNLPPNVGNALAALTQRREKEDNQQKEILERARREQAFLKRYARGYFRAGKDLLAGQWSGVDAESLLIEKTDSTIKAEWVHDKRKKELTGAVINQTAKIRVMSRLEDATLLFPDSKEFSAYAITSEDGREMEWLWFDNHLPVFARFSRNEPS